MHPALVLFASAAAAVAPTAFVPAAFVPAVFAPTAFVLRDDAVYANSSANTTTAASSTTTSTSTSASISVNPVLPAGGVNLATPASTATTYVKSGANVSFSWNYTSLILSPTAINVEVVCTANSQTYTLAQNQSINTQYVVWDTGNVETDGKLHLISDKYTLIIWDSDKSTTDVASAGELSAFSYVFGVYLPQSYQAWPQAAKYVNAANRPAPHLLPLALCILAFFMYM